MRKRIGLVVCAVGFAVAATWLEREHTLKAALAKTAEWNAIRQSEAVLQTGPGIADWPLRAFVPASLLQAASDNLKGASVEVPVGDVKDGHLDGVVHFSIEDVQIVSKDNRFNVNLTTKVSYRPDRIDHWWTGARATVEVQATLLPSAQDVSDGLPTTQLKIVPNAIGLTAGVQNFDVRVLAGLAGVVASDQVARRLGHALVINVPSLTPSFDLDPTVDSDSGQPFGGVETVGAGTHVVVTRKDKPKTLKASFEHWLLTDSGVWALGGKSVEAPAHENAPSDDVIAARRTALLTRLKPFERTDATLELTVPSKILTDFIDMVLKPSPLLLEVATKGTKGNITDAIALHNDKILGNVGLEVRPQRDDFATATIALTPGPASWDKNSGLTVPASVSGTASVALNVHLATGIGGGIGKDINLKGDAAAPSLVLQAPFQLRSVTSGSAILLQPTIACTPMTLVVHPGDAPITEPWIKVDPLGLQLDREIGGMKIEPAVLVDTLPLIAKLPQSSDAIPPDDLTKAHIGFPRRYLVVLFSPESVSMSASDVTVRASAQLSTRDSAETDAEKTARHNLWQALKDDEPSVDCKAITALKLVGGGTTIIDLYKEFVYIGQSLKDKVAVAQSIIKAATDFDPKNTPENLKKVADTALKSGADDAKHVWDTVTHPPNPPISLPHGTTVSPIIPFPHPTISIGGVKF